MAERKATATRAAQLGAGAFARISAEERRRVVAAETARMKALEEEGRQARVREKRLSQEAEARQEQREFDRGIAVTREAREAAGPQITPYQQESIRLREAEQKRLQGQTKIAQERQTIEDTRRQILSTYADPIDAQDALATFYEQTGVWTPEIAASQRKTNAKARVERDQEEIEQRAGREASILEEIGRARTAQEGMSIFEANEKLLSPQARQKTMGDLMERASREVEKARFAWEKHPVYEALSRRGKELFLDALPDGGPQTAKEVFKFAKEARAAEKVERQELRAEIQEAKKGAVAATTKGQRERIAALKSMFRRGMVPDDFGEPTEIQEGDDPREVLLAAIEKAKLNPVHFATELGMYEGLTGSQAAAEPGMVRVVNPQGQVGSIPEEQLEEAEREGYRRVQ